MEHSRAQSLSGDDSCAIPEDLRCKRSDGKQWRCSAMSMPDKTVCEKHYIQAKKRAANSAMRASLKKSRRKQSSDSDHMVDSRDDDFDMPLSSARDGKFSLRSSSTKKSKKKGMHRTPVACSPETHRSKNLHPPVGSDPEEPFEEDWRHYTTPTTSEMDSSCSRSGKSIDRGQEVAEEEEDEDDATAECSNRSIDSSEDTGEGESCHQCLRNDRGSVIWCQKCDRRGYCSSCISKWYSDYLMEELQRSCPACRGICYCKLCSYADNQIKKRIRDIRLHDKLHHLYSLLSSVLPVVRSIHAVQTLEVELEKRLCGGIVTDLGRMKLNSDEQMCCDLCRTPIVDYHRHCVNCSYDLCLACCNDVRIGSPCSSDKYPEWRANGDGSVPCPRCGCLSLTLRRIFKADWVARLARDAEELVGGCRVDGDEGTSAFGKRWRDGEPLVVGHALVSGWNPMTDDGFGSSVVRAVNCDDGSETEMEMREFASGFADGSARDPVLRFTDGSERVHGPSELMVRVPMIEMIHPKWGVLNVASRLPNHSLHKDVGPKVLIAYGSEEERVGPGGGAAVNLNRSARDMMYLLVHTNGIAGHGVGSALWNVFRRDDSDKLRDYLSMHLNVPVDSPLYDDVIYLNNHHQRVLKDEFGVEGWCFEQHFGEAVFVPSGCPFQVRNLRSSVHLVMDFVSPESVCHASVMADHVRSLPDNHKAKLHTVEVGKMCLYAASSAIRDIHKLALDPKLSAKLGYEDVNLTGKVLENLDDIVMMRSRVVDI